MTHRFESKFVWGMLCLCCMVLVGCPSTQPSKFYVLTPISFPEQQGDILSGPHALAIGIGPIEIPDYLDRPQSVKRRSLQELDLAEFHKWAEPLNENVSHVLAENLSALLSTDRIEEYPWRSSISVDYQVIVDVLQFDGTRGGGCPGRTVEPLG